MQVVTEADVTPHSWCCEGCGTEFRPGDLAYGVIEAMTSDGTPIEGGWQCVNCWSES